MKLALIVAFALVASPAFAKMKRRCVSADGAEIADASTMKQCKQAPGNWRKVKASNVAK